MTFEFLPLTFEVSLTLFSRSDHFGLVFSINRSRIPKRAEETSQHL